MASMDWQALAREVISRRVELGYRTRRAFAAASNLSTRTLGDIELARRTSYDVATLARVEAVLEWPTGRITGILRGVDAAAAPAPVPLPPVRPQPSRGVADLGLLMVSRLADVLRGLDVGQRADLLARLEQLIAEAEASAPGERGRAI